MTDTTMTTLAPYQFRLLGEFTASPAKAREFARAAHSECCVCDDRLYRGRWVPFQVEGQKAAICSTCMSDLDTAVRRSRLVTARLEMADYYQRLAPKAARLAHARRLMGR